MSNVRRAMAEDSSGLSSGQATVRATITSEKNEGDLNFVNRDVGPLITRITFDILDSYLYGKNSIHVVGHEQEVPTTTAGEVKWNEKLKRNNESDETNEQSGQWIEQLKTKKENNTSHSVESINVTRDDALKCGDIDLSAYAVTSIPDEVQLCTSSIPGVEFGVCAKENLAAGTWIGPYEGRRTGDQRQINMDKNNTYLWEIYKEGEVSHFIDGSDESLSSWMRFIRCARSRIEQNMGAYQYGQNIYYKACRDIFAGEELLVWYSDHYGKHFEIPIGLEEKTVGTSEAKELWNYASSVDRTPSCSNQSFSAKHIEKHTLASTSSSSSSTSHDLSIFSSEESILTLGTAGGQVSTLNEDRSDRNLRRVVEDSSSQSGWEFCSRAKEQPKEDPKKETRTLENSEFLSNTEEGISVFGKLCDVTSSKKEDNYEPSHSRDSVENKGMQMDSCELKTTLLDSLCSPFQCKQCLKVFTQRIQLQLHVCSKAPYKPYQCGHCASSFAHSSELRNHVIVHMSERAFKCGFCGRTFAGATTLNNHVRTHTGEKPFACEKCGRTFAIATQLSRHMRNPRECPKLTENHEQLR